MQSKSSAIFPYPKLRYLLLCLFWISFRQPHLYVCCMHQIGSVIGRNTAQKLHDDLGHISYTQTDKIVAFPGPPATGYSGGIERCSGSHLQYLYGYISSVLTSVVLFTNCNSYQTTWGASALARTLWRSRVCHRQRSTNCVGINHSGKARKATLSAGVSPTPLHP